MSNPSVYLIEEDPSSTALVASREQSGYQSLACLDVICDIRWARVGRKDKPLAWLHGEVKTPPFSQAARVEAGYLLRELQRGKSLSMPHSRPMPTIGLRCHELRLRDERETWRIVYRVDADAIVIAEVFAKKTAQTPQAVLEACCKRLREYDDASK